MCCRATSEYYNTTRTHLSLFKDTPTGRVVQSVGALTANLFLVA
jgi:hypothetical protein